MKIDFRFKKCLSFWFLIIFIATCALLLNSLFNGDYYSKKGDYAHALYAYKNELLLIKHFNKKEFPDKLLKLGEFYLKQGLYEEAKKMAESGLHEANFEARKKNNLNILLAKIYIAQGDDATAKTILLGLEKQERILQEKNRQNFYHLVDPNTNIFKICDTPFLNSQYEIPYRLLSGIELRNNNITKAKEMLSKCCSEPYLEMADIAIYQRKYELAKQYALLAFQKPQNKSRLIGENFSDANLIVENNAAIYKKLGLINSLDDKKNYHYQYSYASELYVYLYGLYSPEALCSAYFFTTDFLDKTKNSPLILPREANILPKYYDNFKHILYFKNKQPSIESIDTYCNNLK